MISAPVLAQAGPELSALAGSEGPDLTRYLVVCGFLILLVAGLGVGLRRLAASGWRGRARARALTAVDVLPLGGRQKLAVVRCYDRSFLIGVGEKELCLIAALGEDAERSDEAPELTVLDAPAPASERAAPPAAPAPKRERFLAALRARAGDAALLPRAPARASGAPPRLPGGGLLG